MIHLNYKMGIIKIKAREKMANIIYNDICDRLDELIKKAEKGTLNPAYFMALQVGLESDIADSIKKFKLETPKP